MFGRATIRLGIGPHSSFVMNDKIVESVRERWDLGVIIADNCKVSN